MTEESPYHPPLHEQHADIQLGEETYMYGQTLYRPSIPVFEIYFTSPHCVQHDTTIEEITNNDYWPLIDNDWLIYYN